MLLRGALSGSHAVSPAAPQKKRSSGRKPPIPLLALANPDPLSRGRVPHPRVETYVHVDFRRSAFVATYADRQKPVQTSRFEGFRSGRRSVLLGVLRNVDFACQSLPFGYRIQRPLRGCLH